MRPLRLAVVFILLAPLALATNVHVRNVAFFTAMLGGEDLAQPATMPDGRIVTLAQAVDEAAARAGSIDLAGIASGAAPAVNEPIAGDVWVYEIGEGPCTMTVTPVRNFLTDPAIDPQYWSYSGPLATMSSSHGSSTLIIGWTTKQLQLATDTPGFTLVGVTDLFCLTFGTNHLAFPFINGEAHINE